MPPACVAIFTDCTFWYRVIHLVLLLLHEQWWPRWKESLVDCVSLPLAIISVFYVCLCSCYSFPFFWEEGVVMRFECCHCYCVWSELPSIWRDKILLFQGKRHHFLYVIVLCGCGHLLLEFLSVVSLVYFHNLCELDLIGGLLCTRMRACIHIRG